MWKCAEKGCLKSTQKLLKQLQQQQHRTTEDALQNKAGNFSLSALKSCLISTKSCDPEKSKPTLAKNNKQQQFMRNIQL